MGLFDLFKKTDKVGKDSAIDSKEIIKDVKETNTNKQVVTKLSYHPDWQVPQEQKYIFNFLANELEPLKPNQLSLAAINIDVNQRTGAWDVKAFFRNSLPKAIELGEMGLYLLDKDGKVIASKTFNMKELGSIPAESARPWVFTFEKNTLQVDELPEEGWKIAFNLVSLRGHQLDLDDSWKNKLSEDQIKQLEKIVKDLPKLGKTEVNFTGFQIKLMDDQSLAVSILLRNGNEKSVNLEQLPLEIYDANQKQIAKGYFKLDPVLSIQPNSTKPWTFIFPKEMVNAEDADLSSWTPRVPQK
ncbi:accessory Sec system S-layer assembly protein [Ureibacillus acetophenoni]|uniref:Accessory Sec system S-layer assembly protein n=1 Tax=Ureibacillus acetophenoni TaxID=614649 RepID=A0A285U3T1_9BACL|nr:accessory Sec system S-layer assembly protein [Ureibacillus acetophenoni]SOC34911.1 accessory Sec system S-layer assembly protein [Ureibacillus acetophenoni]